MLHTQIILKEKQDLFHATFTSAFSTFSCLRAPHGRDRNPKKARALGLELVPKPQDTQNSQSPQTLAT